MATWRLANSLDKLRDQINQFAPNRSKISDGTIGDAAHKAVASDHNPNMNGVVCALDITHDPSGGLDAHALADRLLRVRHPDLKYIISNYRIAGDWTNWQWTEYYGADPHDTHIHISVGSGEDGESTVPYDDTVDWNVIERENDMLDKQTINEIWAGFTGVEANKVDYDTWLNRPTNELIHYHASGSNQRKAYLKRLDQSQNKISVAQVTKDSVIDYITKNLK